MNQLKGVPGGENLHGSTSVHGGLNLDPLVQLIQVYFSGQFLLS